jgi:FlaA1/EpsC-like NDP-sugar epimerase
MLLNPRAGLVPVAIFDDDRKVHGLTLMGVPVVGAIEDIPSAASRYAIQQVLLTIPAPSGELVERSLRAAEGAGVALKILPGVRDLVGGIGRPAISTQSREPRIEDLLGRKEVVTDLGAVRASLAHRRVLITGAGGSIGSEIARQVAGFDPALLLLLDHDETHLHDTAARLQGCCEQVLVDVRERDAIFETFSRYEPEVVFHAAAHKHVPILESFPIEAVQTNVFGTLNVVEASAAIGTTRLVYISTDKAVEPASVMGASKSVGERILLDRAPVGASYCAVRFGNVLGSRGSVIPTFREQIARGGPVTVTDPHMTRYFMSVEEAVQLVLQASVFAERGDIFMLEMGTPVKILDLAQRMIRLSGYSVGTDIPIRVIGARKGEKIDEELRAPGEAVHPTGHSSILRLSPMPLEADRFADGLSSLAEAAMKRDGELAKQLLFSLCSGHRSAERARAEA